MKKILVISNNPLSDTKNNGKTISSFFEEYKSENIRQIFFSNEFPTCKKSSSYFRVFESDILKRNKGTIFNSESKSDAAYKENEESTLLSYLKKSHFFRTVREILWLFYPLNNSKLNTWLDEHEYDVILFCAGDSIFSYRFYKYIASKRSCKKIVYITDDYILPRKKTSFFGGVRRTLILSNMRKVISDCDLFLTISELMRQEYFLLFGKDSMLFINNSKLTPIKSVEKCSQDPINIVYAGGLHYNRWKILSDLALVINEVNKANEKIIVTLDIFSNEIPGKGIKEKLSVGTGVEFKGSLSKEELIPKLQSSDILLHVEAFDFASKEATKLSISTKIPEYLSLHKPMLAIGPAEIASIEHLRQHTNAFIIDDSELLKESIRSFLLRINQYNMKNYITYHDSFDGNCNIELALKELDF